MYDTKNEKLLTAPLDKPRLRKGKIDIYFLILLFNRAFTVRVGELGLLYFFFLISHIITTY